MTVSPIPELYLLWSLFLVEAFSCYKLICPTWQDELCSFYPMCDMFHVQKCSNKVINLPMVFLNWVCFPWFYLKNLSNSAYFLISYCTVPLYHFSPTFHTLVSISCISVVYFFIIDESKLIYYYKIKSVVYIRIFSLCCTFLQVWQIHYVIYALLKYHAE